MIGSNKDALAFMQHYRVLKFEDGLVKIYLNPK